MERALDTPTVARAAGPSDASAIRALVVRDFVRFFRQRSRVVGALAQPLIFWLVIGSGMAGSFRVPGAEALTYPEYFFPGVVVMIVLFTSIFSTMSVIEDRHEGFLQAVLVAPCSRAALVLGKTAGGVCVAMAQAAIFLALSPLAGFRFGSIDWPMAVAVLLATSVALTSLGFAIAWWLDSTQGYHAVMSLLLIPAWVLSGAMFPLGGAHPVLTAVMRGNPMTYAVSALRRAMYGGETHAGVVLASSAVMELTVLIGFTAACLALAVSVCSRRR